MTHLSTATIDRIRISRANVTPKHLDIQMVDGQSVDGPAMIGERAGMAWAANEADYASLASLAKVRASMSDRQWANSFRERTPSGPAGWFYSLIDPEYPSNDDDDSPGMFWEGVREQVPAEHRSEDDKAACSPDYYLGFADGALAVFEAATPLL